MNREELAKLRSIHDTKGLRLDTASGLSGSIYDADGSATAPVTALLVECARSFDKDAEITSLRAQLEEARANNKRLREGIEIMANPAHWGAALNLSTSIGVKAWDFARALIAGSTK